MREWVTIAEVLPLAGPSLPASMSKLQELAAATWRADPRRFRIRQGRGGGVEYHVSLLPADVRARLAAVEMAGNTAPESRSSLLWAGFERLPQATKDKAGARLRAVQAVAGFANTLTRQLAVAHVAKAENISTSTLWNWLGEVEGIPAADWLAALAPRHAGRTATAECDARAWEFLKAQYLRPEQPNFQRSHELLLRAAAEHGWSPIPHPKTLKRRIEAEFPAAVRILLREGREAAARVFPPQRRDRSCFAPLEAINADGHKFDVFVRPADPRAGVGRMVMTAFQDLYSGTILGWRLDWSENREMVRLAFADVVRDYGIPKKCWLDNGRAWASKWITGRMANRYRFKVKDEEPEGILTGLNIAVHWTTPYHGQAKPIERAFRDLCETIAKHPACAGAYTGNNPTAKPENYGSKAVAEADFRRLVATEIAAHNARTGRRAANCRGRSFIETLNDGLAQPGITVTRATEAQRRLLLLAAEGVTVKSAHAEIEMMGTRYGADDLADFMGRRVVARFDPQDLSQPLAVYTLDGRFVCTAEVIGDVAFESVDKGKDHQRRKGDYLRKLREVARAEQRLSIDEVAALLPESTPAPAQPQPKVVRMVVNGRPFRRWLDAGRRFSRRKRWRGHAQEIRTTGRTGPHPDWAGAFPRRQGRGRPAASGRRPRGPQGQGQCRQFPERHGYGAGMSIPLAMIGRATLEVLGFNPQEFDFSSEATWVGHQVFDDELYWQPTAMGEQTLSIRLACRPHVMGGLNQYEALKRHHVNRDVVPFIRLMSGWAGAMVGDAAVRRLSHTESKPAPSGVGYRHEFSADLILVGRRAGGF